MQRIYLTASIFPFETESIKMALYLIHNDTPEQSSPKSNLMSESYRKFDVFKTQKSYSKITQRIHIKTCHVIHFCAF